MTNFPEGTCDTCKQLRTLTYSGTASDHFRCEKAHERRRLNNELTQIFHIYSAGSGFSCQMYNYGPQWCLDDVKFINKFDGKGILVLEDVPSAEITLAEDNIGYLWMKSKFPFPEAEFGQKIYRLSSVGFWIRDNSKGEMR